MTGQSRATMRRESPLAARGVTTVPFTQEEPEEKTVPANFRCPASLKKYLDEQGLTTTVIRGVLLDKELGERLAHLNPRIDAYAAEAGFSRKHNSAVLLAQLVAKGLEAWEAEQKATRKK